MDNERLVRILQATPEQQKAIDRILEGMLPQPAPAPILGPLLRNMTDSAKVLGVSRTTLWRLIDEGYLEKVKIRARTFRIRQQDLLELAEKGVGVAT